MGETARDRLNVYAGDRGRARVAVEILDLAEAAARISIAVAQCERRAVAAGKEPGEVGSDDGVQRTTFDLVNALFWLE